MKWFASQLVFDTLPSRRYYNTHNRMRRCSSHWLPEFFEPPHDSVPA